MKLKSNKKEYILIFDRKEEISKTNELKKSKEKWIVHEKQLLKL